MSLYLTALLIACLGYLAQQGSLPQTLIAASQTQLVGHALISLGCTILAALLLLKISSFDDLKNLQSPRSRLRFFMLYNALLIIHVPATLYFLESSAVDGPNVMGCMFTEIGAFVTAFAASNLLFFAPLVMYKITRGRELYHFPSPLFDFKGMPFHDPRSLLVLTAVLALIAWAGYCSLHGDWLGTPYLFALIYVLLSWRASFNRSVSSGAKKNLNCR